MPQPHFCRSLSLFLQSVQLGVPFMPAMTRDEGDRNRTSPFAFTGERDASRARASRKAEPVTVIRRPRAAPNPAAAGGALATARRLRRRAAMCPKASSPAQQQADLAHDRSEQDQ